MEEDVRLRPVGIIRSPIKTLQDAPKQGCEAAVEGELIIDPQYRDALLGLQPGQKIVILYWLQLSDRTTLQVHPRGDVSRPMRGVFSTRSPDRPNPIGLQVVDLLGIDGNCLLVRGLDAIDGTPLLDVKSDLKPDG